MALQNGTSISIPLGQMTNRAACRATTATACITDLVYRGVFTGCSAAPKYLFIEAFCRYTSHTLLHTNYVSDIANQAISTERIVFAASVLDGISIFLFFLGILWIRAEQDYEEQEYNRLTCRAADYTLECRTIPPHDGANDLRMQLGVHFEKVLSAQPQFQYNERVKVADINFASSNYRYIEAACRRGALATEIDRLLGKYTSRLRNGTFDFYSWSNTYLLNRLKERMYDFELAHRRCEALQESASKQILKAYITFETEEGYLRCLQTYPDVGWLSRYFQPEAVRLRGSVVKIRKARDPTDIKWENTGVPRLSRILRVLLTTVLTVGLLAASYVMIFEAK